MNPLLQQFLLQEATTYTRKLIHDAVDKHDEQPEVAKRRFEFNRFEITLNFSNATVLIKDVLDPEPVGELTIGIDEFMQLLGEKDL